AARLLHDDGARPGRVAAHLVRLQPVGDRWTVLRLREAAEAALGAGAPQAAAELLRRALGEPPPPELRVTVLRALAPAEVSAGRGAIGSRRPWRRPPKDGREPKSPWRWPSAARPCFVGSTRSMSSSER